MKIKIQEKYTYDYLIPAFLRYSEFDLGRSPVTIKKYQDCLSWVRKDLSFIASPVDITLDDITTLKEKMKKRGVGNSRINSVVFTLRQFFEFLRARYKLKTILPSDIKAMKLPQKEVVYLTPEEVHRLLSAMQGKGIRELRMRALVLVLLASGMRISEALSLDYEKLKWEENEAVITGKGNKQRTIYLNISGLDVQAAVREYWVKRTDDNPALFVTFGKGRQVQRLKPYDLSKIFKYYSTKAGLDKKVTPHILRHTFATTILNNGGDIFRVQKLLGHSRTETTAKHYLGVDKRMLKGAHDDFLRY